MAFRATNVLPAEGLRDAKGLAVNLDNYAASLSVSFARGENSERILNALSTLISYRQRFASIAATPNLAQYAKAQENDPAYDIGAEFTAMIATLDTVITTIQAAFPKDANGFLLAETLNAAGERVPRKFTGAQLAGIVADLDAVVAGIV